MSASTKAEDFFDTPSDVSPSKWAAASNRRRDFPECQLLMDRLLKFAGLELNYPPRDTPELHKWVTALDREAVELDGLQRHGLRYYLLLDLEDEEGQAQGHGQQRAEEYAHRFFMPSHFVASIKGYWCIDNGDYAEAVSCLARPGVDIDLPLLPVIIEMLSREAPPQVVRLLHIARSQLNESLTTQDYSRMVKALSEVGQVNEAFRLLRYVKEAQPEEQQEEELKAQLRSVLETALGGNTTGQPVPDALRQLLHQPLSMQEDEILCSTALSPVDAQLPSSANDLLLDLILNRLVAQGRHLEALRLLNATAIKPASTEAARRRTLLFKSLKSVLTDVDLSVLSLDPESEDAKQQDQSMAVDGDVDMGQHPWAPQEEQEELPAARSLAEAQRNAQSRAQALKDAASTDRKNAPLSASPALRKAQKMDPTGKSEAANNIIETLKLATMSKSPSHFQLTRSPSISRQGSPAASASREGGRPRASGSPFVSLPASGLRNESSRNSQGPTPRVIPQVADVSMNDSTMNGPSFDSPIGHKSRGRGKPAHINIKVPPTPKARHVESKTKRPAPQPQEDAGPSKVQALEPDSSAVSEMPVASTPKAGAVKQRKQTRIQIEPKESKRSVSKGKASGRLPGHFDMDVEDHSDDDDLFSRRTDTEGEESDEEVGEPYSALTQSSSIRKPRHIRANAPEPPTPAQPIPTPRRSARLSASVSREPSMESNTSNASAGGGGRKRGGASTNKNSSKPRGRATRARREESIVEDDEE